jgi:hypothetical protein
VTQQATAIELYWKRGCYPCSVTLGNKLFLWNQYQASYL